MSEVETKKYTITGLVDFTDEQGNIAGQLEVGSVQELPVEVGDAAVADGRAELFEGEEAGEEVEAADGDTTTAPATDAETDAADDAEEDEDGEEDESEEDDTTA